MPSTSISAQVRAGRSDSIDSAVHLGRHLGSLLISLRVRSTSRPFDRKIPNELKTSEGDARASACSSIQVFSSTGCRDTIQPAHGSLHSTICLSLPRYLVLRYSRECDLPNAGRPSRCFHPCDGYLSPKGSRGGQDSSVGSTEGAIQGWVSRTLLSLRQHWNLTYLSPRQTSTTFQCFGDSSHPIDVSCS